MEDIERLAASIVSRNCVLFAGSGLTRNSGGATWNELIEYIIEKFGYNSPLIDIEKDLWDNFDIMQDIIRENGGEEVYNVIREKLKGAKVPDDFLELVKLPWFAVFTTNYDLALENALKEHQYKNYILRVIVTGNEFQLDGLSSELLCVKLMGSLDIPYRIRGSMILDKGDLEIAMEERNAIFRTLAAHAVNKQFIFFGYSFNDDLFLTLLNKLSKLIGEIPNTYYAVFPRCPTKAIEYKLLKNNVKIIVDLPGNFVKKLAYEVSLIDPADYTKTRIQIGSKILQLDATRIGRFLELYNPVLFDELEENIEIKSFLQGNKCSLKPFNNRWHFQRKEIDKIIKIIINESQSDEPLRIVCATGFPGTGRSFAILAAINDLIRNYNSIAVRITSYSLNKIPSFEEIDTYIKEIHRIASDKTTVPERLIFFADFGIDIIDVKKCIDLAICCKDNGLDIPIFLIFEALDRDEELLLKLIGNKIEFIDMSLPLLEGSEKNILKKYLLKTVKEHRLIERSSEDIDEIIYKDKTFLSIVYRTLDPAKRSIDRIITEEYQELSKKDQKLRDCISFCAISSFFELPIPFSVLKGGLEEISKQPLSNDNMDELIDEGSKLIKTLKGKTSPQYSIFHKIIADRILAINGIINTDEYIISLANSIDLRIKTESKFFKDLYIDNGVNSSESKPFSTTGLIKAFESMKLRQPARPVIHHLARLYEDNDPKDPRILSLLDEALREPLDRYFLNERKENILTTKARNMWMRDRELLSIYPIQHANVQKILNLLDEARESRLPNPHPYDVEANILLDLAKSKSRRDERYNILDKAIELINEALEKFYGDQIQREILHRRLIECTALIDPAEAEKRAEELLKVSNDGVGYYTLALIEYHQNKNADRALDYLEKTFKAKKYPLKAISLTIEIIISTNSPDYYELLGLADKIPENIFQDTWKTAYHKAIIYVINGFENTLAQKYFIKSNQLIMQSNFKIPQYIFWMENGRRKTFSGIISTGMGRNYGQIYSHDVPKWDMDIFFSPHSQKNFNNLKPGMNVNFELGFNTRGPIAFELRPYRSKTI